ncbi:MAG TPA: efflux transporter periplasmic adaptor subunit [Gammaproteobacteria bacterium]|nr:efflux transporter periplasmic adaptor subunit [Gammaproteobacteria bacterium]
MRYLITLGAVVVAGMVLAGMFREYLFQPWTRDGHVRAQIIKITPRVGGPIVELPLHDNQLVAKGDLLFRIDPRTYKLAVEQAEAKLKQAQASELVKQDQAKRARDLSRKDKGAISEQALVRKENNLLVATADVDVAVANLHAAKLDLEFTEVRAPVDGYVTNLLLRYGSQTVANQPALALIDINSFWVHGYFKETQIEHIRPDNKVVIKLMTWPDAPLEGIVESMGWGIAQQDGAPAADLLPAINPSFDWIRLAQRIPVRIRLTHVPEEVDLRVGTTASVFVMTDAEPAR